MTIVLLSEVVIWQRTTLPLYSAMSSFRWAKAPPKTDLPECQSCRRQSRESLPEGRPRPVFGEVGSRVHVRRSRDDRPCELGEVSICQFVGVIRFKKCLGAHLGNGKAAFHYTPPTLHNYSTRRLHRATFGVSHAPVLPLCL